MKLMGRIIPNHRTSIYLFRFSCLPMFLAISCYRVVTPSCFQSLLFVLVVHFSHFLPSHWLSSIKRVPKLWHMSLIAHRHINYFAGIKSKMLQTQYPLEKATKCGRYIENEFKQNNSWSTCKWIKMN